MGSLDGWCEVKDLAFRVSHIALSVPVAILPVNDHLVAFTSFKEGTCQSSCREKNSSHMAVVGMFIIIT